MEKVGYTGPITLGHIYKGMALTEAIKEEEKKADGTEDCLKVH